MKQTAGFIELMSEEGKMKELQIDQICSYDIALKFVAHDHLSEWSATKRVHIKSINNLANELVGKIVSS